MGVPRLNASSERINLRQVGARNAIDSCETARDEKPTLVNAQRDYSAVRSRTETRVVHTVRRDVRQVWARDPVGQTELPAQEPAAGTIRYYGGDIWTVLAVPNKSRKPRIPLSRHCGEHRESIS
jgi:hypothetical protein